MEAEAVRGIGYVEHLMVEPRKGLFLLLQDVSPNFRGHRSDPKSLRPLPLTVRMPDSSPLPFCYGPSCNGYDQGYDPFLVQAESEVALPAWKVMVGVLVASWTSHI